MARAEIDVRLWEGTFVVAHDEPDPGAPPVPLRAAMEIISASEATTIVELDLKDPEPWPWPRVEELARLIEPVRERVVACGQADWNLRRLLTVDPSAPVGFDPALYLDWTPEGERRDPLPGPRAAYGYFDAHPLAWRRTGPTADYLHDRFGGTVALVPGAREIHLRLSCFERMLDDGFDAAAFLHASGTLLDVWTLDAGTPRWRERLARALAAGVDMVTTNTARAFVDAA